MEIIKEILTTFEHNHVEKEGSFPPDGIISNIHDGALVCSGTRHITGDLEQVKQNLEKETGQLDAWVEEQGGITGHIKAIVNVNGPVFKISAIAGDVECTDLKLKDLHVTVVAIVFQIDQESLEQRVESLFEKLLLEE